ncbi:obg [Symbiodinium pilosum]|uniref:Obg protein n=1 Tax=Symbiodinium pilosum TaxID=2952 RepID=A0A812RWI6_SYMPI|nr:obg [Symbiodinium pilosum]
MAPALAGEFAFSLRRFRSVLLPQLRHLTDAAALAAIEGEDAIAQRGRNKGISSADPSPGQVVEILGTEDVESFPRLQRPFVDRMWLSAKAGNGGNPAPNANRRPHIPTGPGYGGHGGSVILKATTQIESFLDVPEQIKADHGGDGYDTSRGKHGKDYVLQVPLGTIVRERVFSGERTSEGRRIFLPQFRYQFLRHEDTYIVARGGTGGVGPKSFKKGDSRRPTHGQRTRLELELRLMNDAALVGMPNAGKTSLLAALSRAHTRIGPEEFSTTRPHVGVIQFRDRVEIRVCDLPGLSEGAHEDKLMGRRILRHTYRSRALAFVVNVARGESSEQDVLSEVEMLREEAIRFDPLNKEKPWMVIGTKCDLLHRDPLFHLDSLFYRLRARYGEEVPVVGTSSRFGLGITRTVRTLRQLIYPDMLEARPRLGADPELRRQPKVLHGPYLGPLPSLGEYADPRTQPKLLRELDEVPKLTP